MTEQKFYEENAQNAWWNTSSDTIQIESESLWELMKKYANHQTEQLQKEVEMLKGGSGGTIPYESLSDSFKESIKGIDESLKKPYK